MPLPDATRALLRSHWRTPRTPLWLFPAPLCGARMHAPAVPATTPSTGSSLQSAFVRAVTQSGVHKRAHVHTLRHSSATHLLEAGVTLRLIQDSLGHMRVVSREAMFDGRYEQDFDVSKDGTRFLMIESESSGLGLVVVPGWLTELRQWTATSKP